MKAGSITYEKKKLWRTGIYRWLYVLQDIRKANRLVQGIIRNYFKQENQACWGYKQKAIDITYTAKSIRFDVYVEDEDNTVYDIEMQTDVQKDVAKRSRYYQGMIDLNLIEKGEKYSKLKTSYIIFICMFDPFEQGRHIYTFENRCIEDLDIGLGDETTKIFLNPYGTEDDISMEMDEFLKFVAGQSSNSRFTSAIQNGSCFHRSRFTIQMVPKQASM